MATSLGLELLSERGGVPRCCPRNFYVMVVSWSIREGGTCKVGHPTKMPSFLLAVNQVCTAARYTGYDNIRSYHSTLL